MAKVKISFEFTATASFVLEVDEAAVPSYTTVARAAEAYVKAAMSIGQGGSFPWAVDTTGMRMTPQSSYDVERVEEPADEPYIVQGAPIPSARTREELMRRAQDTYARNAPDCNVMAAVTATPNPDELIPPGDGEEIAF